LQAECERLRAALVHEKFLLHALMNNIPDHVYFKDRESRFISITVAQAQMFGLSDPDQAVGKTDFDFFSEEHAKQAYQDEQAIVRTGQPITKEEKETWANHSDTWVSTTKMALRDDQGSIVGTFGISRDITKSKEDEAELRIAATAFESREGMFVTNTRNVILRVNNAFTEITGYSAQEAVGQTPKLISSGRHDAAFYGVMHSAIAQSGTWQGEIWDRRKNGEEYPQWLTITAVKDGAGEITHYVATMSDITERKMAEDEIKHLAFYDSLTGLPNRRLLIDRLEQALASRSRHCREGALLFIDLDNFKTLNDTRGHDKGDMLLQQVAQRLATCVRKGDTVARLGGDEFVVILEDLSENAQEAITQTKTVGEKILAVLDHAYELGGYVHHCSASIGVTLFADHQQNVDDLLQRADLAMYQAKAAGRNTLRFFDPVMQAVVTTRVGLESGLRDAMVGHQFLLHYQPQVDSVGKVIGAEALLRWQHPQRGLVFPGEFIPVIEETGMILPVGRWVLETACERLVAWAARPELAHLSLAVNVSARQFHQPDFVAQVLVALERSGANPQRLKLELTESLLIDDVEDVIAKMVRLKDKGVCFSLDDFGTGYSSLSYLKRLPLDQLKIDQSFVRDIQVDPNDAAIARTIIALAKSLGLDVIAEGVETQPQLSFLDNAGCPVFQGYLFSRPLPQNAFDIFVMRDGQV
jgi:diguanylate cyclase (GGDEF)-like protein/PAS domain S-box-containing protein